MKALIRFSAAAITFLVLSAGCSKPSDFSGNYIRGKIDGVAFECNTGIWATNGQAGDKIIAFRGDVSPYSFRFYLDGDGSDITEGTYFIETGKERSAIVYENNDGYSAGYFCGFTPCFLSGSGKITILSLSKKYIKGNFEFVTGVSAATGQSKTVTEGAFYIKRD